ncbi:MAG TPA: META domain-containing protein [Gemmatimonadaceae bacterium]|nr:META domain-containing protein [Gemmatimonadaceae bacterium]
MTRRITIAAARLTTCTLCIATTAWLTACSRERAADQERSRTASSASGAVATDTTTPDNLAGTHWRLVSLQSKAQGAARPDDPSKYTLAFDSEGGIAYMRLDCNRANGPYEDNHDSQRHGGTVTIGPLAMTRAACPAGSLSDRVAHDVTSARSYQFASGQLSLHVPDGSVSVWQRETQTRQR